MFRHRRVQLNAAGQVELRLKTPWRDGLSVTWRLFATMGWRRRRLVIHQHVDRVHRRSVAYDGGQQTSDAGRSFIVCGPVELRSVPRPNRPGDPDTDGRLIEAPAQATMMKIGRHMSKFATLMSRMLGFVVS